MINLLPPVYADAIRYGRKNTRLSKWLVAMLLAIAGLVLIIASGLVYIDRQTKGLESDISNLKQQLQAQNLSQVQKDAADISANIRLINQVLSKEITFSALIQDIGKVMPPGSILDSLRLGSATGAIDISAKTLNQNTAAQIAVNLNDPKNSLFDKVDIVNISCSSNNDAGQYRCTTSLKALFSADAQKKYLNVAKDGGQ